MKWNIGLIKVNNKKNLNLMAFFWIFISNFEQAMGMVPRQKFKWGKFMTSDQGSFQRIQRLQSNKKGFSH